MKCFVAVLSASFLALTANLPAAMADAALNRRCDELAASALDVDRTPGVKGIARGDIDKDKAIPACEAALKASPENAHILFTLGRALDVTGVDVERSATLYQKVAEAGSVVGMHNTGFAYRNAHGVKKDYALAVKWYRAAADRGFAMAQSNLGHFYRDGIGVPQDYALAKILYEKAAASDYAEAMNDLGRLYDNGWGVKQDYAKAREWYEKAIALGDLDALNGLGWMYDRGVGGLAVDHVKANVFYKKAVDAGNAQGMDNLGESLIAGEGIAQDKAAGLALLNRAVDEGNGMAANNLAGFYARGESVDQDFVKSATFYLKAIKNGSPDAKQTLIDNRGTILDPKLLNLLQDAMQTDGLKFERATEHLSDSAVQALREIYEP